MVLWFRLYAISDMPLAISHMLLLSPTKFFQCLHQKTLIHVLRCLRHRTLELGLFGVNLDNDLQPIHVEVSIRMPHMSARVKLPTSSSVVPLEFHFLRKQIHRGLLVLVDPAIGLSHGSHKADKQSPVLVGPGAFYRQRGKLIVWDDIDESADLVESLFISSIVEWQ